ncbi:AP-5 complex subunit sigma-1 [Petaurus breviceps papuanus]|uniref:AP-5 complex subunit sigma-1 n=1 Tax=Petaurus breviceps papuanus TaxID=3040969 RepID=UPI0036DD05FA
MVHAFLIHTLNAQATGDAAFCRVLYSRVFGSERSPDDPRPHGPERDRLLRKEQLLAVARQAESACKLLQQASGRPPVDLLQASDEPISLHDAPSGVFRLRPGDPFQGAKVAVWLGLLSLGCVLVCEPHENLLLAENTLRQLARLLLEHLKLLSSGSNVLLKADRIESVLNHFLPQGQLLFLNDQFVQALEKELSASLSR